MREAGVSKLRGREALVAYGLPVIRAPVQEDPELEGTEDFLACNGADAAGFSLGGYEVGDVDAD